MLLLLNVPIAKEDNAFVDEKRTRCHVRIDQRGEGLNEVTGCRLRATLAQESWFPRE